MFPVRLQSVQRRAGRECVRLTNRENNAGEWFWDHEVIPAIEVPRTICRASDRNDRDSGDSRHQYGTHFELIFGSARPIRCCDDGKPFFHHALHIAKGEGTALVCRTTNHFSAPGSRNAGRNIAVNRS